MTDVRNTHRGQSLIEVIIAMALFGLLAASMVSLALGGFDSLDRSDEQLVATALVQEGMEAVRSIRDGAWNELHMTTSSVTTSTGAWTFVGEGTNETIGEYTRTISLAAVCRDATDSIVTCPGLYEDVETKYLTVTVSWQARENGDIASVTQSTYLTNWDSMTWTQTDWSGGAGQGVWSQANQYDSDDGGVETGVSGQVLLLALTDAGAACTTSTFTYSTSTDYLYNPALVQFVDGAAALRRAGDTVTSSWPLDVSENYSYDPSDITVSDGVASLNFTATSSVAAWDFSTPAEYTADAEVIEVSGGIAQLKDLTGGPTPVIRMTEYYVGVGDFPNTIYTLQLDQDLATDYYILIQGSDGNGSQNGNTGPDEDYIALRADPFGTGELSQSSAGDELDFLRGGSWQDWVGVITVVECLSSCDTAGFRLRGASIVTQAQGTNTGTETLSGGSWTDATDVVLFGGWQGAGCYNTERSPNFHNICYTRLYPTGTGTINWNRYSSAREVESTVLAVEFGSAWTVQHAVVSGTSGGDGADATNEYDTASIAPVSRDTTMVWGTGHTNGTGLINSADGSLITLGDGVSQLATESLVAVGQEVGVQKTFDVYTMTHPDLAVDYRFKSDGDSNALTLDVTVDEARDATARMSWVTNGSDGGGTAFPRSLWSSRFINDTTVRLERRRSGQPFPAWIQSVDAAAFNASEASYATTSPSITPTTLHSGSIKQFTGMTVSSTLNGGSLTVQLSGDGSTWRYWNGTSWATATGVAQSNSVAVANAAIGSFPTSTQQIVVRAFLTSDGTQQVQLDDIAIRYDTLVGGYPTDLPVLSAVASTTVSADSISQWSLFQEQATTNGGNILYQLSDDSGSTWQYWDGSSWSAASGSGESNDAQVVATNIFSFSTSTGDILWRAFFDSDGTQEVILDDVVVGYEQPGPDAATVGQWHLDDTSGPLRDSSGNNNHLTVNGSPTYGVAGQFDEAVTFGNGIYGSVADAAQTGLDQSTITLEAWIYKTSNGNNTIMSKWSGSDRSYYLETRNDNALRFGVDIGGSTIELTTPGNVISFNTWHHVAAVHDGLLLRLYVDGQLTGVPIAAVGSITDSAAPFTISASGGAGFPGRIDEVRVSSGARYVENFTPAAAPFPSAGSGYSQARPAVEPYTPISQHVGQLTTFEEDASIGDGGAVTYQLSLDGGTTWQYWDGSNWTVTNDAANANTSSTIRDQIWKLESGDAQLSVRAFLESDGAAAVALGEVRIGCTNFQMEVGTVSTDETWAPVVLEQSYTEPVVVASVETSSNVLPATVRIRNMTSSSFEMRLHNPSEEDLATDEITYLVMEAGKWTINGMAVEADRHQTATVTYGPNNWDGDDILFQQSFGVRPAVAHTVQTLTDPSWITSVVTARNSRNDAPDTTGFDLSLGGMEVTQSHGSETIGWIAFEGVASTTVQGQLFESVVTTANVSDTCSGNSLAGPFVATPLALTFQQSMRGNDGSWLETCSRSQTAVFAKAVEDQVSDSEQAHTAEYAGILAIQSPFATTTVGTGVAGYELSGSLYSSAFPMGDASPVQVIQWKEDIPDCSPACTIRLQVRSAPDSDGAPGAWSSWYGATGPGSFFTTASGTLVSTALNGAQWVQYHASLTGDGSNTPVLTDVHVNYK